MNFFKQNSLIFHDSRFNKKKIGKDNSSQGTCFNKRMLLVVLTSVVTSDRNLRAHSGSFQELPDSVDSNEAWGMF